MLQLCASPYFGVENNTIRASSYFGCVFLHGAGGWFRQLQFWGERGFGDRNAPTGIPAQRVYAGLVCTILGPEDLPGGLWGGGGAGPCHIRE